MAYVRKRGDMWIAQVDKRQVRAAKSFPTKAQASAWAGALESEIMAGHYNKVPDIPVSKLLEWYA